MVGNFNFTMGFIFNFWTYYVLSPQLTKAIFLLFLQPILTPLRLKILRSYKLAYDLAWFLIRILYYHLYKVHTLE